MNQPTAATEIGPMISQASILVLFFYDKANEPGSDFLWVLIVQNPSSDKRNTSGEPGS
jgi:hypothetical protein